MEDMLLPLVTLVTPNVPEAVQMYQDAFLGAQPKLDLANLISEVARDEAALQALGRKLSQKWQVAILLKGGHRVVGHGEDVLFVGEEMRAFPMHGEQEATRNLHGTGCTLSSAIAANLAKGETLEKSVEFGKAYMDEIWNQGITLSSGAQLLWHARKNA